MIETALSKMALFVHVKEILDSGDPLIRSWVLINDYYTPFVLCGSYLLLVTRIIPSMMRHRKPMSLRNLMIAYNFFVVFSYLFLIFSGLHQYLTTDCIKFLCREFSVRKGHYSYKIASLVWFNYLLKYIEFADTIFFALRKKDHLITKLHLIHHTAFPVVCWLIFRIERTGFQVIPGLINCVVHVILYTYYGLAAIGPSVQKYLWWKKYVTMIQIMQFVIQLMYILVLGPMIGCKTSKHGLAISSLFIFVIFILFYNFYYKTYILKSRKKTEKKIQNNHHSPCKNWESNGLKHS